MKYIQILAMTIVWALSSSLAYASACPGEKCACPETADIAISSGWTEYGQKPAEPNSFKFNHVTLGQNTVTCTYMNPTQGLAHYKTDFANPAGTKLHVWNKNTNQCAQNNAKDCEVSHGKKTMLGCNGPGEARCIL